jgi:hypothetical protein
MLFSLPAAKASATPFRVSWSVKEIALQPFAAACLTTSDGESSPSEAVEWLWRSATISGISGVPFWWFLKFNL